MQSSSWLLYLVVVAILTIGVALTIWLIIDYEYGVEPRNNISDKSVLRIRSTVLPDAIVGRTSISNNYYMIAPQIPVDNNSDRYPYGVFTTFTGAPTETFTINEQTYAYKEGVGTRSIDVNTSVNIGAGNRGLLIPNGSNTNAFPMINTANNSFGGTTAYQYYGLRQYEDQIGIELNFPPALPVSGLYVPFLQPVLTAAASNTSTSIGSSPIYKMLYNKVGCIDGRENGCPDGSVATAAANNAKMRVRYAPASMEDSDGVGLPNITGLRQYPIDTPETPLQPDGTLANNILEYLFYVDILES